MKGERGFSLVETLVVVALVSAGALCAAGLRGARTPVVHAAALGLQAAVAEARTVAMSRGARGASGSMLVVRSSDGETTFAVYAGRPIGPAPGPMFDAGFPIQHYAVTASLAASPVSGGSFSVLISASGYASVAANDAYDSDRPTTLASDPGCNERDGVAITFTDGVRTETHRLDCREVRYDAGS